MPPGSRAYESLYNAVDLLGMKFSTKHNAKWGLKDAARMISTMSVYSICAHQMAEMLDAKPIKKRAAPVSQWFLSMVQSVNLSEVEEKCDAVLHSTVADAVTNALDLLQKEGRPAVDRKSVV